MNTMWYWREYGGARNSVNCIDKHDQLLVGSRHLENGTVMTMLFGLLLALSVWA